MTCKLTSRRSSSKVAARDQFILNHLELVKGVALQIRQTLPVHVELDDLVQSGALGLLDAANKFDPEKQVPFSSYARFRIRGAILDSLRDLDTASRDLRRKWKNVEAVRSKLRGTLQRDPNEEEIAERLGMGLEQLRKILLDGNNAGQTPVSVTAPDNDGPAEHEFQSGPETRPDLIFSRVQLRAVLSRAMLPLRPRQQQVVRAYYSEDKTMKEIGLSLGINESRVSQLHKSALERMRAAMEAKGLRSGREF